MPHPVLFIFIYFNLMLPHSQFYLYSTLYIFLYCTFLPYFNPLYIMLLLCHSICFILRDMLYILMLLYVIYFRYTTHSICISSNSEGSKKLPDDGRLLPKHVGASTQNKGVLQISAYCWSFLIRLIMHGINIKLFRSPFDHCTTYE
jgi:hypothetical protein